MREIQIPFVGFYESKFSEIVDSFIEREAESIADEIGADRPHEDSWGCVDYRAAHNEIARAYVDEFARILEEYGFQIRFRFKELDSPREYNFRSDKIWCEISDDAARRIVSAARKSPLWAETIKERHQSRSGFISFYSADLSAWAKPWREFDHNELSTCLLMLVPDFDDWGIYYRLAESDYALCADHVDYDKLERLQCAQFAQETLAALNIRPAPQRRVDYSGRPLAPFQPLWDDDDAIALAACVAAGAPDVARVAELLDSGVDVTAQAIEMAPAPFDSDPYDARLAPRCNRTPDMFGDSTNA